MTIYFLEACATRTASWSLNTESKPSFGRKSRWHVRLADWGLNVTSPIIELGLDHPVHISILHSPPIAANTPVLALTKAKRMHTIGNGFATNAPEAAYFCVSDLSWRDGRLEV